MKLKYFVPKALQTNRKALVTAKMILQLDATIAFFSVLIAALCFFSGFLPGVYIAVFSFVSSLIHPYLMYRFDGIKIPIHFFCFATLSVFCGLSFYTGGVNSSFLFWTITIVPIGIFYLDKQLTWMWSVICICIVLGFVAGDLANIFPPSLLGEKIIPWVNLANILALSAAFIYIVYNFKVANAWNTKRMARMNEKLQQSNLELEKFASVASHDLKTPLRNITGFLQMLRKKHSASLEPQALNFLDIIESNANSMTNLIGDILEYSRSNGADNKKEMVDLNKIMNIVQSQIANVNTFPNCKVNADILPNIITDQTRIHQIFQNLVENGLKYNKSEIRKVDVRYHCRNNQHHFEFSDNGIGIEAKHSEKIFEMFQRLHNQSEFKGSGIGLATTKRSVERLGGTIKLISALGRGSSFRVMLPVNKEDHLPSRTEVRAALETID